MKILKIEKENMLNGPGIRLVVWLSGCEHKCDGCHNPWTHDSELGRSYDKFYESEILSELSKDIYDGITFSGGDPLYQSNLDDLYKLCSLIRKKLPNKTIWVWTGYLWGNIIKDSKRSRLLKLIDVLVDGPFIKKLYNSELMYRGSSNQRVIDCKKSSNSIVLYKD